ncbi:hypothetical protein [Butyrivibrio proteoclasticus]|nr:hypothetical protein [Butyrivibrio proteoclasticus]
MNIRQAKPSDASRIAEMIVTNYRKQEVPVDSEFSVNYTYN